MKASLTTNNAASRLHECVLYALKLRHVQRKSGILLGRRLNTMASSKPLSAKALGEQNRFTRKVYRSLMLSLKLNL